MSQAASQALFALVESFFTTYLPRQRGASPHTIRAYRDMLKLLLLFATQHRNREVAALRLDDLDANMIAAFLDHLETTRSNSAATRNCRRAALRSFFKHLLRNDLDHALRYTQVLALPAKRAPLPPGHYLEAPDIRAIIEAPDRRTRQGWRDYTLLLFSTIAAHGSARRPACHGVICN
ncbi:site-specific integrase [Mesorhizobium sp.]|uniref:tyrosine-type recombinase/integrase n=1 Tax=Mesorhizobium sp. TaxID=1871066 RepID=UPI002580D51F|nr:site-specific integrase [Mesorhizobium sp.]